MTHLLYFKKLKDNLPNIAIDTEYPSKDWLLSEIFVQYISNSKEIQHLTNFEDSLYIPEDTQITQEQLDKIKNLYSKNQDILIFRDKALKVLK